MNKDFCDTLVKARVSSDDGDLFTLHHKLELEGLWGELTAEERREITAGAIRFATSFKKDFSELFVKM